MATWAELRATTFRLLDLASTTTGDDKDAVDDALQLVHNELVHDARPSSLFEVSSAVSVTSSTTAIGLSSGSPTFAVSDLWRIYGLAIDTDSSNDDDRFWKQIGYEEWLRANDPVNGNQRAVRSWTIDQDNNVYLSEWPGTGITWEATLYYWKNPTTFADGASPDFHSIHHLTIAVGAATMFPHKFQGDRMALFAKLQSEYEKGRQRILADRRSAQAVKRMKLQRPRVRTTDVMWGD